MAITNLIVAAHAFRKHRPYRGKVGEAEVMSVVLDDLFLARPAKGTGCCARVAQRRGDTFVRRSSQPIIGVVGLGLLGREIAACMLIARLRVIAFTVPQSGFAAARETIDEAIRESILHQVLTPTAATEWSSNYSEAESLATMDECDFVIESIPEDLFAKNSLYEELERVLGRSVPIATNTSAIPISLIQSGKVNPGRFIGMHWMTPGYATRFLEIIAGDQTDVETIDTTVKLARLIGKDPATVRKDIPGFIANRLAYAMYREAFHLVEAGVADVETIDRCVSNVIGLWAAVAGPFRWMDLTGLSAYAAAMERLFPTLSNATTVPRAIQDLIKRKNLGADTGRGFYEYSPDDVRRWRQILREHAWRVREIHAQLFPLESAAAPEQP